MKGSYAKFLYLTILVSGIYIYVFFFCPDAFAAEKMSSGRRLWDNIMLWVNFGILVFFFIKYARKPLMDFLRGIRDKIKNDLDTIETQFKDAESRLKAESAKIEEIEQHIETIRKNIIEMGKKERDKIIEQAKITADRMIEDAKAYSGYQLARARKELSDEMVDIAVSMVKERLIKGISDQDNEKLINQFIVDLGTSKQQVEEDFR
jgi:F-type H+-transporting ATPase subunit b